MTRPVKFHRAVLFSALALAAGTLAAATPVDALREWFGPPVPAGSARSTDDSAALTVAQADAATGLPPAAVPGVLQPGLVNCANLVYGEGKSSVCFSSEFLAQTNQDTHARANERLVEAHLESVELFQFPFAVMTGEGGFTLTDPQRRNLRDYLQAGGFILASAGCSSEAWRDSFRSEIAKVFPELSLKTLDRTHPVFHTVYDIDELKCKGSHVAHLEGLEIDGKIVLIFSPDGLNDTSKAGGNCCCCGGNEIRNARQMNVNLLAYTLTH
jgi:hypothetical protein